MVVEGCAFALKNKTLKVVPLQFYDLYVVPSCSGSWHGKGTAQLAVALDGVLPAAGQGPAEILADALLGVLQATGLRKLAVPFSLCTLLM